MTLITLILILGLNWNKVKLIDTSPIEINAIKNLIEKVMIYKAESSFFSPCFVIISGTGLHTNKQFTVESHMAMF